jgi:hypothetical protein
MKKLKLKLKKWFFNTFVKRYLATVDSTLLGLFTKEAKESNKFSYGTDRANAERKRIITMLSSKKYKEYFYKAIKYERNKPEVEIIQPFGDKIWDRIKHGIATAYLYLFDRNLYDSIQLFKKWRGKISTVESQVNDYMANTTLDERADRAIALGIVEEKKGIAQKRMRKIQSSRVDKILAQNQV